LRLSAHKSIGLALAFLLGGCMSAEQLLLPNPVPATGPAEITSAAPPRTGVRLGDRADPEARRPSVLTGTDELIGSPKRDGTKAAAPVRDGVTLNLSDASIAAAARAVLGDTLRQNFTVSEKVRGNITLQTAQPVSRERLLEMFEAALQTQGAGIVVTDGTYQILPLDEAISAGGPIRANGGAIKNVVGVSTQVVPMRYVAAADIERLLKPMAPRNAVLRADAQRNVLILTGSRVDLATLADAISIFDVDWMRGMSFAIYPLESADPEAIVQELDTVFANDREGGGKIIRFIPNRRLKGVLVVTSRKEMLPRAHAWIRKLDMVGQATTKQAHVYHVQNRPAVELAQLLQKIYASQEQPRGATAFTATGPPGSTQLAPPAQPSPADTIVPGVPLTPRQAAAPAGIADAILSPVSADAGRGGSATGARSAPDSSAPIDDRLSGISIVADEQNNSVIITATASEWRRIRQILERIDVAPAQVMLEATIAEVTLNDQLKLGMRWYFERNQSQFRLGNAALGAIAPALGFSYFLNSPNVQVVLNALATITDVNIVSSPTLMVLDNKKATLQVGDEVPYPTQSAVGVLAPGAPIVNSITSRSTGIMLGITPRISDKGRVLLDIEQEVSEAVETTSSTLTNAPTIQQRRVRTTVAVSDGESIVLAGMMQDKSTRKRDQLPLFGSIPIVGNLFKDKTDTVARTELLIAITPRIVTDRVQMRGIVDEFRGKLNFNTRPQRDTHPDRREQLDRLQR
jgi:general secretion pathway protein D